MSIWSSYSTVEPHRNIGTQVEAFRPNIEDGPHRYFEAASKFAHEFYASEISRISSVKFEEVSPDFFFTEYIWVVHATGFSANAVGKFMPRLMEAYGSWDSLSLQE